MGQSRKTTMNFKQENRRFIKIERKSFELSLGRREEVNLRITENGHKRRSSVILMKEDMKWMTSTWEDFWAKEQNTGWYRRRRTAHRTFLFQLQANKWGRIIVLSVVKNGVQQAVVCPEGTGCQGWKLWSRAMLDLIGIAEGKDMKWPQRAVPSVTKGDGRSWKEIVMNQQRNEAQSVLHRPTEEGEEFLAELCCGNCGWKLEGTFKTMTDGTKRFSTKLGRQVMCRKGSDLAKGHTEHSMLENEQAKKENRFRGESNQHVYGKANSMANFELTGKGRKRGNRLGSTKSYFKTKAT